MLIELAEQQLMTRLTRLLGRCTVYCLLALISMIQRPVGAEAPAARTNEETEANPADVYKRKLEEFSREGVLIAMADSGKVVFSRNETQLFNPASNTKVATSLVILRKLGPIYRFPTQIRINGKIDAHGELQGDLFISGQDPLFGTMQSMQLAKILRTKNIKSINGDLCVTKGFSMDYTSVDALEAGKMLLAYLDPHHPSAELYSSTDQPTLKLHGQVKIGNPPVDSRIIACHQSVKLQVMLKRMLCFSDNVLAERFGDMIGGPSGLSSYLVKNLGISKNELSLATTSGERDNRMSPRAMMKILTSLKSDLLKRKMDFSDLLAVTGVDNGTLKGRLCTPGELGSVVAKTGSIGNFVGALSGEMNTCREGRFLFVIFHMNGVIENFRKRQDKIVSQFQMEHSGAKAYKYTPIPLYLSDDYWSKR